MSGPVGDALNSGLRDVKAIGMSKGKILQCPEMLRCDDLSAFKI